MTKTKTPPVPKEYRLTIRLSEDEQALIPALQEVLKKQTHVNVNQTGAVVAALRIAAEKLNVTPKDTA